MVILALGKPDRNRLVVTGTDTVQRLYGGIEQDGAALGPPGAAVSISIYNDMQCSTCADWFLETVPPLVEDYVRTGKAKLVYHHFSTGQKARQVAFYAAVAAGKQGYQWPYVHVFMANQRLALHGGVTDRLMKRVAEQVPQLDLEEWDADRQAPQTEAVLEADDKLALDQRLPAEPAVIVDGPGGQRKLVDSPDLDEIEDAIRAVG
jgi:protein-disulfide isomerase